MGLLDDWLVAMDQRRKNWWEAAKNSPIATPGGLLNTGGDTSQGLLGPALDDISAQSRTNLNRSSDWRSVMPGVAEASMRDMLPTAMGANQPLMTVGKFDLRFDPRIKEAERLASLRTEVIPRPMSPSPTVSLADFEGSPFITSMSDRTAAGGTLAKINDVQLNRPVDLRGGQDFMFDNPGQVWSSAPQPVKKMAALAEDLQRVTGKDPLFIPWRMAPTGGDFAAMTGEAMLAHADAALGKTAKKGVDKLIKSFIPEWSGVSSDAAVKQFRDAPDAVRKAIKNALDVEFRERGGLSLGEARLSVADPKQLMGADGQIMNIGRIDPSRPVIAQSGHPSYPRGLPGEGIGRVDAVHNIFEMLPSVANKRGLLDLANPRQTDLRALQMKPYAGIIDADLLRRLGY